MNAHKHDFDALDAIHVLNSEPGELFGPGYIEYIARDAIRDLVKSHGFEEARAILADELNWIAGGRK